MSIDIIIKTQDYNFLSYFEKQKKISTRCQMKICFEILTLNVWIFSFKNDIPVVMAINHIHNLKGLFVEHLANS